ncbi:MAG TPA: PAS domain S-box protein [candidate division Zixibacteria bacterium]|nr:PAS domain S-box protein [candidate division Zixibacteria bacterium]
MNCTPDSDGPFRPDREQASARDLIQRGFDAFDRLPVMVFEVDRAGNLTDANQYWLHVLGYERTEVIDRSLRDFVADDSSGQTLRLLLTLNQEVEAIREIPVRFVRSDESVIETMVSAIELGDRDRAVCMAQAITSRSYAETMQATLVSICRAANGNAGIVSFFDTVRHQMSHLMDSSSFYIALQDETSGEFTIPYCYDRGIACHDKGLEPGVAELDRLVINDAAPRLVDRDAYRDLLEKGHIVTPAEPTFCSWMAVPLLIRQDFIGLVGMSTYLPGESFTEHHLQYLSYVAEHIACAVDRIKREECLRQSEEKYRLIFERAVSVIALVDPDGTIVDCNTRVKEIAGYNREELIGQPMSRIVHPDYLRRAESSLQDVLTKGANKGCDFKMVHRDGHELDVVVYSSGLTDAGGDYFRSICVIDDITGRMATEEALRASEETNRALFQGCGDAIAISDLNDNFIAMNPAMEKLFGFQPDELLGHTFPGLDKIDTGKFKAWVKSCRKGEPVSNYETVRPHKSGQLIPVSITVSPVMNPDGTLRALSFFYRDLSMRRKTELKLAEMQQLKSLALLAGGIAHDFNNIMTAILGNINLAMLDVDDNNEAYDRLRDAEAALVRAQSLTHQLLTFSKGGAPIRTTAAIPEIIADSAGFALTGSRTRCEFDFAADLRPVEVDRGQFSQVIHNLIINADQAMPGGGVVRIRAANIEVGPGQIDDIAPGQYIRISISDQGSGIPKEYLKRVFEPFFTTKQTGNGLGLATSFSIIKRHDGHIDIESQVGQGTTFNIYLPASRGGALSEAMDKSEECISTASGRALVMDDEEAVRKVAGSVLSRMGFKTDLVDDGRKAVEQYTETLASGQCYDIVILDLTVPGGMGAEETIKQLKEIDPDVRAVVASGYTNDTCLIDHEKYGFADYIIKPFRVQELKRIALKVVAGNASRS